jgi:hypothetical protein
MNIAKRGAACRLSGFIDGFHFISQLVATKSWCMRLLITVFFCFCTLTLFAQTQSTNVTDDGVTLGMALGVSLAVVTSWSRNESVGWAILHGLFNWLYVLYFAVTRQRDEED